MLEIPVTSPGTWLIELSCVGSTSVLGTYWGLDKKVSIFQTTFSNVVSRKSVLLKCSVCSWWFWGHLMTSNRQRVITWSNDNPVLWRICASPGLYQLTFWWSVHGKVSHVTTSHNQGMDCCMSVCLWYNLHRNEGNFNSLASGRFERYSLLSCENSQMNINESHLW